MSWPEHSAVQNPKESPGVPTVLQEKPFSPVLRRGEWKFLTLRDSVEILLPSFFPSLGSLPPCPLSNPIAAVTEAATGAARSQNPPFFFFTFVKIVYFKDS